MAILADQIKVNIGGSVIKNYEYSNFRLLQELGKPNEFRFHMRKLSLEENDEDITFSLSSKLLGKSLEFSLSNIRHDESGSETRDILEFSGIVFNARAIRGNMGAGLVIEVSAFSPDYMLFDSPHCFSYEGQNLESIVSSVVSPTGISMVNQPAMSTDILYTVQYNETNYDFLLRLAHRFGEWFYYNGKELVFGKVKRGDAISLYSEVDILNYEYELKMKHLNFTHLNHNYLEYTEYSSDGKSFASGAASHIMNDNVQKGVDEVYKHSTYQDLLCSNAEDNSLNETELSAKAQSLGRKSEMTLCKASSNRADLTIGSVVTIKESFETSPGESSFCTHDDLLIYRIEHRADAEGFYENHFTAIPATAEYPPYDMSDQYPRASAQRAVVKDNKDPEKLGRVRVQFHWQKEQDASLLSPWLRISQPHGGGNKGFYFIPEIDEEVMVGFENGNAEKPYIVGTLYHGQAKPPDSWYNDEDNIKAIRTRSGHTIEFHDTEGEEFIKIYDNEKDNFILTFSTHEQLIKLQSKGNIELYAEKDIVIDARENISITAGKNISETAEEESITVQAAKNIDETAGENRTETIGSNLTVKAGSNIKESAGDNIKVDAGKNIDSSAGKSISESAVENIAMSARKNLTGSAAKDLSLSASDDVTIGSGKEMNVSSGKGMDLTVGKTMKTKVRENYYIDISKKSNFKANSIEQISDKDMTIKAGSKLEQKASSGMKIDGGSKVDVKGTNVKIN